MDSSYLSLLFALFICPVDLSYLAVYTSYVFCFTFLIYRFVVLYRYLERNVDVIGLKWLVMTTKQLVLDCEMMIRGLYLQLASRCV